MRRKIFLPFKNCVCAFSLVLCTASLCAEKISFSAGSMKGIVGDKSDTTELSGGAYVLTESMEISADSIKMSGKDFRFIEASGTVKGKNSEAEL
ncbi:MAG: organic solvent tolerance protein OstA, partial [Treponema sp.]